MDYTYRQITNKMRLKITNNLTKAVTNFDNLENIDVSRIFYCFEIRLPEGMADGEYTYELFDGTEIKATGLLQIGEYVPEKKNYNGDIIKEQNGYKQYNG